VGFLKFQRALKYVMLALLWGAFAPGANILRADGDVSLEYQVKAAFVFNFARFVTWPAGTFASPEAPLEIGLLGRDAFTTSIQKTLDGKTVEGRPLLVKQLNNADTPVQILVVSAGEKRVSSVLKTLAGKPTLTVGESRSFLKQGGMIRLGLEDDKVRFSINQPAVDASGLVVSSQMLQYASDGQ
jgi:hypothetical protein